MRVTGATCASSFRGSPRTCSGIQGVVRLSPAPGEWIREVTSGRIVRGGLARIERRRISSRWARTARGGVDSVALGSHYASRTRPGPERRGLACRPLFVKPTRTSAPAPGRGLARAQRQGRRIRPFAAHTDWGGPTRPHPCRTEKRGPGPVWVEPGRAGPDPLGSAGSARAHQTVGARRMSAVGGLIPGSTGATRS